MMGVAGVKSDGQVKKQIKGERDQDIFHPDSNVTVSSVYCFKIYTLVFSFLFACANLSWLSNTCC